MSIFRIAYTRLKGKIMDAVIEVVLGALPNAGDRKTYAEVYELVPEAQRRHLRNALLSLKKQGLVKAENTLIDGKVLHELVRQTVS